VDLTWKEAEVLANNKGECHQRVAPVQLSGCGLN